MEGGETGHFSLNTDDLVGTLKTIVQEGGITNTYDCVIFVDELVQVSSNLVQPFLSAIA